MHENLRKCSALLKRRNMLFHDNGRSNLARIHQEKYWIKAGLFNLIRHIHQILHQVLSIFLIFYKILWMTKNFLLKIRWKYLWKTSWAWNRVNFTWEESTSNLINGKRWFKIIGNIQLIEINQLLNFSWINNISQKRKLFMTQLNIYIYMYAYICIWK